MHLLDLSFDLPAANLALDEALLLEAEEAGGGGAGELLRLWEFRQPTVIVGRSSKIAEEVDLDFCRQQRIPVLRRCSGGASVVGGPGCLMYSVVLDLDQRPHLRMLDQLHQFAMQRVVASLSQQLDDVQFRGTCDVTLGDRKVSGNSVRVLRDHALYHGTVLYDAPLDLIARCLAAAPRQPEYRAGRDHRAFIENAPARPEQLRSALCTSFGVAAQRTNYPAALVDRLIAERYSQDNWTHRR